MMHKYRNNYISLGLMALFFVSCFSVQADDKADLMALTAKLTSFQSKFAQRVVDPSGSVLQKGQGILEIAQPKKLRWELSSPSENMMISDGKTLWLYDIDLEQVTIYDAAAVVENSPFVLLTAQDNVTWAQYNVKKHSDKNRNSTYFSVVPIEKDAPIQELTIRFGSQQRLNGVDVTDSSGQKSYYDFSEQQQNQPILNTRFEFVIPEDIDVDDQRTP